MNDIEGRRPLKVRGTVWSKRFAKWLTEHDVAPNQISVTSVFFAALAAGCLFALPSANGAWRWLLPVSAAVLIQCRLLCNLFDGMVAVEGGKGSPSGELFNDIPDRIADPMILVAAGHAAAFFSCCGYIGWLGWCAGLLSVMTAYVRTLTTAMGALTDFRGPMAKQHRMALMTGTCVLTSFEFMFWRQGYLFTAALSVMIAGCIVTLWRRIRTAYLYLEGRSNV